MGIILSNAALLVKARQDNVCFDQILTIGHQTSYLSQEQIRRLARRHGLKIDISVFHHQQYADRFFEAFLGAKSVLSLDYSDYEGCDIIHDMNQPIDPTYHERFDAVIDGGSLEHIFHFPMAMANCMQMIKKGGSLFLFTVANNHTGHGFYQFSPELFFRILQPDNGFEIRDLILEKHPFPGAELSPRTKCFSVVDPAVMKERVGLVCSSPVMILIHAVRTEIKPVFAHYPIQSDYQSQYDNHVKHASDRPVDASFHASVKKLARRFLNLLPSRCRNFIDGRRQLWRYSFLNGRFYKRWYPL